MPTKKVSFECSTCGDKINVGFPQKKVDLATLILFTKYHTQSNERLHGATSDIDDVIRLAESFESVFGKTDWEKSKVGWDDAVAKYYNVHKHPNWNEIEMASDDPYIEARRVMGTYLSNDPDVKEYNKIIKKLLKAYDKNPNDMLDFVKGVVVWEKVEMEFTVEEFLKLIGLKD